MADLRWYRIEVSDNGKVVSCTAVEHASKNGRSWYYVQARDEKAAAKAAFNAYYQALQAKRRAELSAQGKCRWCGRKADRGTKRCSRCLERDVEHSKRARDKAAGKPVVPADRMVARAERKAEEQREVVKAAAPSLRLEVLLEVQQAWQDSTTNGTFTRWLEQQIKQAGGVKRAG